MIAEKMPNCMGQLLARGFFCFFVHAPTPPALKAVVWDMDGTLVHFKIDYVAARLAVGRLLAEAGVKDADSPERTHQPVMDQVVAARKHFRSVGTPARVVEDAMKRVDLLVREFEEEAGRSTSLLEGIVEVLEAFRERGLRQAVWTLNHTDVAKATLERLGVLHFFQAVVGRDAVANPKPHPDHLLKVMACLGVTDPRSVAVVGDHPRDAEGGRLVGARTVALVTPRHHAAEFGEVDVVVHQGELGDLPKTLI
ncbi:MAG: N-acetylmuramic acid 6-phosphate phosphatase MupP [Promethearchaeota archaeon]